MKGNLLKVTDYFAHFGYVPTFDELYTFFPVKISKKKLKESIDKTSEYTLGEYNNKLKVPSTKFQNSLQKIRKVQKYIRLISSFPQIRLIGLSGSVAMLNAKKEDDVDLFIISSKNRVWTARFIANLTAWLFKLKRGRQVKNAKDMVCLNLFFSESSLMISEKIRTEYMAHEVLQMVPVLDVNQTYRKFLFENDWIQAFFPNVSLNRYLPYYSSVVRCISCTRANANYVRFGNLLEGFLKKIQLLYMSKPTGDEQIKEGQLWFHPRDYSRKVKSRV